MAPSDIGWSSPLKFTAVNDGTPKKESTAPKLEYVGNKPIGCAGPLPRGEYGRMVKAAKKAAKQKDTMTKKKAAKAKGKTGKIGCPTCRFGAYGCRRCRPAGWRDPRIGAKKAAKKVVAPRKKASQARKAGACPGASCEQVVHACGSAVAPRSDGGGLRGRCGGGFGGICHGSCSG
eukprot:gene7550-16053_t